MCLLSAEKACGLQVCGGVDIEKLFVLGKENFDGTHIRSKPANRRMGAAGQGRCQQWPKPGLPGCTERMRPITGLRKRQRRPLRLCGRHQAHTHVVGNKRYIAGRGYKPVRAASLSPFESRQNPCQGPMWGIWRIGEQRHGKKCRRFTTARNRQCGGARTQRPRDMLDQWNVGQDGERLIGAKAAAAPARQNEPISPQSLHSGLSDQGRIAQ